MIGTLATCSWVQTGSVTGLVIRDQNSVQRALKAGCFIRAAFIGRRTDRVCLLLVKHQEIPLPLFVPLQIPVIGRSFAQCPFP